ncbi:uncharacterized protein LY89DRAFT_682751 [Mollisia scopiformis]|uniref:Uncharacterized protein n=1 Tax=Mollisia scopiformis TaxID=149040 RepID=A0A194XIG6_MOLSC|nr:uncharacterized protein LY89DRAFT_682751 [Mollisia scopiformis]KUJ19921.1 hypothetical protein LY89DRAFT_682751 [Mollisia scopiformis]
MTSSPTISSTSAISPSDSSTNPSQTSIPKQGGNRDWIAGAVLGPIVLILILATALYWFCRGKKRKRTTPVLMDNPDVLQEKPQLHGDSLIISPYELQSNRSPDTILELPARERVAVELPGDNLRTTTS